MLFLDLLPFLLCDARVPSKEIEVNDAYASFLLNLFCYFQGLSRKVAVYVYF